MANMTSRQRQAVETKICISEKAIELFMNQGYQSITIKDICEAASISVGTFYHYYQSKEDILSSSHRQLDLLLKERLLQLKPDSPEKRLHAVITETAMLLQDLGWRFVSGVHKLVITAEDKYILNKNRFVFSELQAILCEGKYTGYLKQELKPLEMTENLMRCCRGVIYDWCLHDGDYNLAEKMWADVELMLHRYLI